MSTVSVGLVRLHRHFNKLPEDSQGNLAVREGFEPSVPCGTHTFQACSFGHSDNLSFEGTDSMLLLHKKLYDSNIYRIICLMKHQHVQVNLQF